MLALGRAAGLQHRRIDGGRHRLALRRRIGREQALAGAQMLEQRLRGLLLGLGARRALEAEQAVERRLQADRQFLALQRDLQCDAPMLMRAMPGRRMGMGMRMGTGSDGRRRQQRGQAQARHQGGQDRGAQVHGAEASVMEMKTG